MSKRLPVEEAPGSLEDFARRFDDLFSRRSQRDCFRRYLEGLLLSAERNKTLTALANTEPIEGATKPEAQRMQWFLSESTWEQAQVGQRRQKLLCENEMTSPAEGGALVIDETGNRKWGDKTAHVGRQYLGSIGKTDNGVVTVHTLLADERLYYPMEVEPYTPSHHFENGKSDAAFRTKPEIASELVEQVAEATQAELPFRAVVADSLYGSNEEFKADLRDQGVGYVMALKPSHAWWHKEGDVGSVEEAARAPRPDRWQKVERCFRDGHTEDWWALEGEAGLYGPERTERLVVVTTDPKKLPSASTWYLAVGGLPAPDSLHADERQREPADLAEIVRLYGLRIWIEQSYKQVKGALGWTDYQVRSDEAMRRHWQLVCCAFSFCWWALPRGSDASGQETTALPAQAKAAPASRADRGEDDKKKSGRRWQNALAGRGAPECKTSASQLAEGAPEDPGVAGPLPQAQALLESVVRQASTSRAQGAA